jgi:hypothetical protein
MLQIFETDCRVIQLPDGKCVVQYHDMEEERLAKMKASMGEEEVYFLETPYRIIEVWSD